MPVPDRNTFESAYAGQWNTVRRWYVNGQGETMMVIPTAAADRKSQLTTGLAISGHEVTVAEFLRFREKHGFERRFASSDDCLRLYHLSRRGRKMKLANRGMPHEPAG